MKKLLPLLLAFLCFTGLNAQDDDCAFTLSKAQKLYDAGNIEQIPTMLQTCLNTGFNREENLQAYKLLVLSYLFDSNEAEAEKILLSFLRKYPEYQITTTDPAEFVQLFSKYRTLPLSTIGVTVGANYSNMRVTEYYGTYNLNSGKPTYTNPTPGFQLGILYSHYITDQFDAGIEARFVQTGFDYSNKINNTATVKYTETQNRVDIPVFTTYTPLINGNFIPFAKAGINTSYLLNANATASYTLTSDAQNPRTGNKFNVLPNRAQWAFGTFAGIGIKYRIKKSYLVLDVRYNFMLNLMNKPANRYNDLNTAFYYNYTDNDMKMNNIFINFSYVYAFYKPKKK